MNDNLKHLKTAPDPEVWKSLNKAISRRTFIRRNAIGGAVASVVLAATIAVVVLAPDGRTLQGRESVSLGWPVQKPAIVSSDTINIVPQHPLATHEMSAAMPHGQSRHNENAKSEVGCEREAMVAQRVDARLVEILQNHDVILSVKAPEQVSVPELPNDDVRLVEESEGKGQSDGGEKVPIRYSPDESIFWIPNIFIPGSNDEKYKSFRIYRNDGSATVKDFRLHVYNRAGQLVYHSTDINESWDGTYNGRALPQAAYVYIVAYTDKNGAARQEKGTVSLLR